MLKARIVSFTVCAALVSSLGWAATPTQRLPGVVDKDIFQEHSLDFLNSPQSSDDEETRIKKPKGRETIATAEIKQINISGVTVLPTEVVNAIKNPYVGRALTESELVSLKYDLTKAYFDRGYILVKVTTPPQDTTHGLLKIVVIEGLIGEIEFHNKVLDKKVAAGLFSRVKHGEIFLESIVETALNDLNGLKNIQAQLRLEPGGKFGYTKLNVHAKKVSEDINYLDYNNHGANIVSRDIITLGLQKSNVLSLGETIEMRLNYGPDELRGGSLKWTSPIPKTDLFFNAGYTRNDIDIVGRFRELEATGKSQSFQMGISRNILNLNIEKLTASFGAIHRQHRSFLRGTLETKDIISKLQAKVNYLRQWRRSLFYIDVGVLHGINALGATESHSRLATRNHNPRAWIIAPTIIMKHEIIPKNSLLMRINAQYATGPLLSSDLFSIGGYGSVRGFEPGQETGEAGWNLGLEYQYIVHIDNKSRFTMRPFIDSGAVYNRLRNSSLDSHLYGGGFGLDIDLKKGIAAFGKMRISFDIARAIGGYTASTQQKTYFYFHINQTF